MGRLDRASPAAPSTGLGAVAAVTHGAPAAGMIAAAVEEEPAAIFGQAAPHRSHVGAGQKFGRFEGEFVQDAVESAAGPLPFQTLAPRDQASGRHGAGGFIAEICQGRGERSVSR